MLTYASFLAVTGNVWYSFTVSRAHNSTYTGNHIILSIHYYNNKDKIDVMNPDLVSHTYIITYIIIR